MRDAGAVHLQQWDAGRVAADRRPHGKAQPMRRHRHVRDRRAELREALRGVAHPRIHVGLRVGMAEAFLQDADAQSLDATFERIGIAPRR